MAVLGSPLSPIAFLTMGSLAKFIVPGPNSLQLSRPKVQLDGCWLPPRYTYH